VSTDQIKYILYSWEILQGSGSTSFIVEVQPEMELEQRRISPSKIKGGFIPFLVVFIFLAVLSYLISFNLFRPLAWSALLSFLVYPIHQLIYKKLLRERWSNVAAFIMTVFIIVLIVLPTVMVGFVMAREGVRLYSVIADYLKVSEGAWTAKAPGAFLPEGLWEWAKPLFEQFSFLRNILNQSGQWVASSIATISRGFLGNAIRIVLQLIVIAVASFFLIRDGHLILDYVKDITPLPKDEKDAFYRQAKRILQAVLYGITLTAIIQGILGGIGWWYVGLPTPLVFGAIMTVLAMFPIIGTPLVWVPGSFYLLYTGEWKSALLLFIWGLLVVSLIDNVIRPIFISEGSNIHLLIVFVGVLGGLTAWGFIGLFLGPLVITLFVFMLDNYRKEWKIHLSSE